MSATLISNTSGSFSFKLDSVDAKKYRYLNRETINGTVLGALWVIAFISIILLSSISRSNDVDFFAPGLIIVVGGFAATLALSSFVIKSVVTRQRKTAEAYRKRFIPDFISAFKQAGYTLSEKDTLALLSGNENVYTYFTDVAGVRYRVIWMQFATTKTGHSFSVDFFLDDPDIDRRKQEGRLREIAKEGFSEWHEQNPGVYTDEFVEAFMAGFIANRAKVTR